MSTSEPVFEAVIVPHRSLGATGLRWVAGALMTLSGTMSLILWLAGAWPVIGFTGVEAGLAIWLIRRHARERGATEVLTLSAAGLRVVALDRGGRKRAERLLPAGWLLVSLELRPGTVPALWLRGGGMAIEVAQALGEDEKRDLAEALSAALHRLRHPVFDPPLASGQGAAAI